MPTTTATIGPSVNLLFTLYGPTGGIQLAMSTAAASNQNMYSTNDYDYAQLILLVRLFVYSYRIKFNSSIETNLQANQWNEYFVNIQL